ncbi:MAG: site-specific integrase [Prevotellaceae bacterium]|nr:site-specific integrase [Prevotellaceae bacterium]
MRVTLRGQTPFDIPTGHNINVKDWDLVSQRALPTYEYASEINRTIDEWKSLMNEIFARYELLEKRIPEPGELKDLFNDMAGRKTKTNCLLGNDNDNFFRIFDLFTKTLGRNNQWSKSTYNKFSSIRMHLKSFDPLLSFRNMDDSKLHDYLQYLNQINFRNSTTAKHIAFIRWFLRWSSQKGYYNGTSHVTFKPKIKGIDGNSKEIIYLTKSEIKTLRDYKFLQHQSSLERVRDVFLFCCFTGLRYSDVAKLKRTDIKEGFIDVVTKKTNDGLRIELNKHSQSILDKYKDNKFRNNLALPVISNVKMNTALKILGQTCGIDDPTRIIYFQGNRRIEQVFPKWALLTTHCGRRTFVVTALQLGIPVEVIMKWTGHSSFSAMKPYVQIVDELKARSMSKFDELL